MHRAITEVSMRTKLLLHLAAPARPSDRQSHLWRVIEQPQHHVLRAPHYYAHRSAHACQNLPDSALQDLSRSLGHTNRAPLALYRLLVPNSSERTKVSE